jgi:anti-sigma regulatory factor (Ser/Thr protein kinase)
VCWEVAESYHGDVRSPAAARRFTVDELSSVLPDGAAREAFLDDVTVIVSEFLTNSVKAGSSIARLKLTLHRERLRLAVHDDAPGQPVLQAAAACEAHGRGIAIAARLSSGWGSEPSPIGKQTWAELPVPAELTAALTCEL